MSSPLKDHGERSKQNNLSRYGNGDASEGEFPIKGSGQDMRGEKNAKQPEVEDEGLPHGLQHENVLCQTIQKEGRENSKKPVLNQNHASLVRLCWKFLPLTNG